MGRIIVFTGKGGGKTIFAAITACKIAKGKKVLIMSTLMKHIA